MFAVVSVVVALVVGPRRYNKAKLAAYECGIEPVAAVPVGQRFPRSSTTDRDAVHRLRHRDRFLYPWAVSFDRLGTFALIEMAIFMATVFVAYAYVWRRGGLEWD